MPGAGDHASRNTLGDLNSHPVRKLIGKELTLGAMNGLLTGTVAGVAMWWSAGGSGNDRGMVLGLVILFAMTGACMASGLFGVLVPLTLRRFVRIPAPHRASSSPQEPISLAWGSCWDWPPCWYFRPRARAQAGFPLVFVEQLMRQVTAAVRCNNPATSLGEVLDLGG